MVVQAESAILCWKVRASRGSYGVSPERNEMETTEKKPKKK